MKKSLALAAMLVAVAAPAFAADLPVYTKAPPPVPVVVYNWTGFYVGGNIGYSWGRARADGDITGTQNVSVFRTAGPNLISSVTTPLVTLPISGRTNVDGFVGGVQAGYNWQVDRWVWGLEADFQGSDEHGRDLINSGIYTASYKYDWFGTLRGRGGILASDRVLLYATGGLAYGHFAGDLVGIPGSGWGATKAGWTVGAGVEGKVDQNWSVKLEYLYVDLGTFGGTGVTATNVFNALNTPSTGFNTVTTTNTATAYNTRFTDHVVRIGVNYKFGGPVVAKY